MGGGDCLRGLFWIWEPVIFGLLCAIAVLGNGHRFGLAASVVRLPKC